MQATSRLYTQDSFNAFISIQQHVPLSGTYYKLNNKSYLQFDSSSILNIGAFMGSTKLFPDYLIG